MKKTLRAVLALALMTGAFGILEARAADTGAKIGYVDLVKMFEDYQRTKELNKEFEAKGALKEAERTKMATEIKKMREELELLSVKAREEKAAVVEDKMKALQDFDRTTRDSFRKERDTITRDVLKEMDAVIQAFGKSQGYSFILSDKALVYKGEGNDVTAQVTKALNDSYAAKKK